MAGLMAARLGLALLPPYEIPQEIHRDRANRARQWAGSLALPGEIRAVLMRVIELCGRADRISAAAALVALSNASTALLDEASRGELGVLAERLAGTPETEQKLQQS